MTDMKSAFERAMEKAEKIGKATPDELKQMEAVPTGNQLAGRYMKEPDFDLAAAVDKYKGTGLRKPVIDGALEILVRYLTLTTGSVSREAVERAKKGILSLKESKKLVQDIFAQLDNLLNYYEQARQQLFNQMKQTYEQQMGQQMRPIGPQGRGDVTAQPQFREEMGRRLGELNRQYEQALEEQRQRIVKAQ